MVLHGSDNRPLTSSPESALESDLQRISDLVARDGRSFTDELDRQVRANFTNDYWQISLPNRLDTAASRSPALFAYLAALNLLDAEPSDGFFIVGSLYA